MRAYFDHVCFGWLHHDRTFEPVTMPMEWRHNYQAHQILDSRAEEGYGNTNPVFAEDPDYPTQEKISAAQAEFLQSDFYKRAQRKDELR